MHFCKIPFIYLFSIVFLSVISSCQNQNQLPDPLEAGWKGKQVCEVLIDNENVRTLKCSFPPGVGHEKHFHATHYGYTLAGGKFRITDAKGTREVEIPTGYDFYNGKKNGMKF